MRGWLASMMNLGEAYPSRCVSVNDTLMWGDSLACTYDDGAGQPIISVTDGWYYIPIMKEKGRPLLHAQETYLHGTPLRNLWSVLAHGALIGTMYQTGNDASKSEPCVWVTHEASEASSYTGFSLWSAFLGSSSITIRHGQRARRIEKTNPSAKRPRGHKDHQDTPQGDPREEVSAQAECFSPTYCRIQDQNAFPQALPGFETTVLMLPPCWRDSGGLPNCLLPRDFRGNKLVHVLGGAASPAILVRARRGHANQLSYSEC